VDVSKLLILVLVVCSASSPLVVDVTSFSGQVVTVEASISVTVISVVDFLFLVQPPEQLVTVPMAVVSLLTITVLVML
jgi:hypothetical protein